MLRTGSAVWDVRRLQLRRWVIGHNECFHRYGRAVIQTPFLRLGARLDLFLALASYWNAPVLLLGWSVSVMLFLAHQVVPSDSLALALLLIGCQMFLVRPASLRSLGLFSHQELIRVLLLPISLFNYIATTGAVLLALLKHYSEKIRGRRDFDWHKTIRYQAEPNGKQNNVDTGNGLSR